MTACRVPALEMERQAEQSVQCRGGRPHSASRHRRKEHGENRRNACRPISPETAESVPDWARGDRSTLNLMFLLCGSAMNSLTGRQASGLTNRLRRKGNARLCRLGGVWTACSESTADDSCLTTAARRPGPGRRRRPQGRSGAEHLDAAEHGGIIAARRRLHGVAFVVSPLLYMHGGHLPHCFLRPP
jgi:hypothetical protein